MLTDGVRHLRGTGLRMCCGLLAAGAVVVGLSAGPVAGWPGALSAAVAVSAALLALGWRHRVPLVPAAWAVACVSAATTLGLTLAGWQAEDSDEPGIAGMLTLAEMAALLLLTALTVRFATAHRAAVLGAALGVLASTAPLRVEVPPTFTEVIAQSAFVALAAVGAATVGGALRSMEMRRLRAVAEARRSQRLQLARDLHDFVAHDVSGIVALAQGGQAVGAGRPDQLLRLLERIEASGLQALGALDRRVQMLDGAEDGGETGDSAGEPTRSGPYGLEDIDGLVERFRESSGAEVRLDLGVETQQAARVPREAAATAHRVVAEALTNVRRHTPSTPLVEVAVTLTPADRDVPAALTASIDNAPPAIADSRLLGQSDRRRSGTGLAGLRERVAALDGTLVAGERADGGWTVRAKMPVQVATGRRN